MLGMRQRVGEICCQNVRFGIGVNRSSDDVQLSIILSVSKGGEVFLHFTLRTLGRLELTLVVNTSF